MPAAGVIGDRAQDAAHVRVADVTRASETPCAAPSACPACCSARGGRRSCRAAPNIRAAGHIRQPQRRATAQQSGPVRAACHQLFPQHPIGSAFSHSRNRTSNDVDDDSVRSKECTKQRASWSAGRLASWPERKQQDLVRDMRASHRVDMHVIASASESHRSERIAFNAARTTAHRIQSQQRAFRSLSGQ